MLIALAALMLPAALQAAGPSFDQILGEFRQRMSGVCVIYAHALAVAEYDPSSFTSLFTTVDKGWRVRLNGGRFEYVTRKEVEKSIADHYSAGEPDNLLTVYSIAVSKATGGYSYRRCQLDYGPKPYSDFVGTGKWTLYDDGHGEGRKLADGLDRLVNEARPDGSLSTPSTIGFGAMGTNSPPEIARIVKDYRLVGIHDFSVSGYDAAAKDVLIRNPHNPKVIIRLPIDDLRRIPAGIDFMEK